MNGGAQWAIEIAGLEKRYGDRHAVDGIDLRIAPGEVFGLLGPNGAGKTTTVETLEGYRNPDAGTVRVLGLDPIQDGPSLRPRIGVMLQEGGLYPGVRPLEALRLFAAFYPDPDDPERLLDLVGLREAAGTYVRRLSGGECQRLSLALALVGRPEVVFLDEPTAGMDPRARATTWQLVRSLRDAGTTVVLTTHHMDEAEHLCDRLAIIDKGRIVSEGTPADITNVGGRDLHFSTTAGIDLPAIAAALSLGAHTVFEDRPGEYTVRAVMTPELVADLAIWLRDKGYALTELRTGRATLEEVFLQLTREDTA
ncbi:MAG: ABC transporter ATP-binding protein [Acidimicrobiia bacterium]